MDCAFQHQATLTPTPIPVRIFSGDRCLLGTLTSPSAFMAWGEEWPPYLQGPLIQGAVLALDPVARPPLQPRVLCTSEDGAVLLQTLWGWVLGTGEHLWEPGRAQGPEKLQSA